MVPFCKDSFQALLAIITLTWKKLQGLDAEAYFVKVSAAKKKFWNIDTRWKGQKDNAAFLLGGKDMGVFPMSMSLIAR